MRRSISRVTPLAWLSLAFAVGCADAPGDASASPEEHVGAAESEIINGEPDTTHQAVVALFGQFSGCTGTIIHHDIGTGTSFILTAAHCFEQDAIQQVAIGNDYQTANQVLQVTEWDQHPQWNSSQLSYDFAMIRAVGGNSSTPSIPVLTPAEDTIGSGTALTHVGYGVLSAPNGSTTSRHYAGGYVNQVASIQFDYEQPNTGPCSGDSGGPNLVDLGEGERVAGVISYGDETCATFGVSGRASSVNDFITGFMGVEPPSTGATTSSGAGAGGPTGGTGAGGAGASSSDDGFFAGDNEEADYDGQILSTGSCTTSAPASNDQGRAWPLAGLALLGLLFTRRERLGTPRS